MNSSNSSACRAVNSSAVTIGLLYGVFVLASVRMGGRWGGVCVWGGGEDKGLCCWGPPHFHWHYVMSIIHTYPWTDLSPLDSLLLDPKPWISYPLDPLPPWIHCPPGSTAPLDPLPPWIHCPPGSTAPLDPLPSWIYCPPGSTGPLDPLPSWVIACACPNLQVLIILLLCIAQRRTRFWMKCCWGHTGLPV